MTWKVSDFSSFFSHPAFGPRCSREMATTQLDLENVTIIGKTYEAVPLRRVREIRSGNRPLWLCRKQIELVFETGVCCEVIRELQHTNQRAQHWLHPRSGYTHSNLEKGTCASSMLDLRSGSYLRALLGYGTPSSPEYDDIYSDYHERLLLCNSTEFTQPI